MASSGAVGCAGMAARKGLASDEMLDEDAGIAPRAMNARAVSRISTDQLLALTRGEVSVSD